MIFTRLGYGIIMAIIAVGAAAVVYVLRPADGRPEVTVQQVIDYSQFGLVDEIEVDGRTLTVRFDESLDTQEHFGDRSHEFEAELTGGDNIEDLLRGAGVLVGPGGVEVVSR